MKSKLKLTLILFIFLGSKTANSQNAYYDAMLISRFVKDSTLSSDSSDFAIYGPVLNSYLKSPRAQIKYLSLLDAFSLETSADRNPILETYFNPDLGEGASPSLISGSFLKSGLSSLGNLNVTNFADGLAKFLVARAKEELNVAFFTKLQAYLREYPEVKVVFPNTYDFMDDIYAYQYAAMLPALRAGFQTDMNNFSENLVSLRERSTYDCYDSDCPVRVDTIVQFLNEKISGRAVMAAILATNSIMKGQNAAEILDEITLDKIVQGKNDNLSNSFHLANLISGSLRSKEEDAIWVNKTELSKLISNRDAFRIYLGLLYALDGLRPNQITFSDNSGLNASLKNVLVNANTVENEFNTLKQNISAFGSAAAEISTYARTIVEQENSHQNGTILMYANYARAISNMLKQGISLIKPHLPEVATHVEPFLGIIDDATNACYDVKAQNYGSLVLHTSDIMANILREKYTYKDDYIKYGSFMAGIIEADNSDEVKAAIEAAVLPVGSSSIKRETISNISLNGYIGPMAGYEYLGPSDQWAPVIGVTAPVGVAFSWGRIGKGTKTNSSGSNKDNTKGGKSFTLFIPVIDVGSIATFRLGDETSNVAAEIKLENIIAPGLYAYYGLGKLPISIGLGGQIGPQLREINATEINIDKNFYVRFGLNVVVDIPFFNFYTKN